MAHEPTCLRRERSPPPTNSGAATLGVQTDSGGGDGVYALFEDAPSPDGTVPLRVERFGKMGEPTTLFQTQVEAARSALWLLGVVDGAARSARTENDITDAGAGPIPALRRDPELARRRAVNCRRLCENPILASLRW